jgi:hypothetical protein
VNLFCHKCRWLTMFDGQCPGVDDPDVAMECFEPIKVARANWPVRLAILAALLGLLACLLS